MKQPGKKPDRSGLRDGSTQDGWIAGKEQGGWNDQKEGRWDRNLWGNIELRFCSKGKPRTFSTERKSRILKGKVVRMENWEDRKMADFNQFNENTVWTIDI